MKGHRITKHTQLKTRVQICNWEQPWRNVHLIFEWEPCVKVVLHDSAQCGRDGVDEGGVHWGRWSEAGGGRGVAVVMVAVW